MKKHLNNTYYIIILSLLFFLGCTSSKINENNSKSETKDDPKQINISSNKGIEFSCELGKTNPYGENFMIDVTCTVKNKTNNEINYLCESCNGLDYYLTLEPNTYKVMPQINCNATWTMISKISSGDSIVFKTQILKLKDSPALEKIGLDFRAVDKFIPFDSLRNHPEIVDSIYRNAPEMKNIIWGSKN